MSAVPPESPRASAESSEPASDKPGGPAPASTDFGPNEWLVDELYQRYLADPGSVDMAWWSFFADYQPPSGGSADLAGPATTPSGAAAGAPAGQAASAAPVAGP